ncbi:type IV toxin-antitoxin system AbiEi family antitoxin domain-containing protein [Hyphomonas sp.]|uniref:type IV toxin-antitoxin system AbiEi family antitoxin domain-containing protein n=1 Tax=Hyphomonas sp. TaxID=87 RepID=UPI003527A577
MSEQNTAKLNQLMNWLLDGVVVDAATLEERGYASNLRTKYLQSHWLSSPARGVFKRPGSKLTWQSVVYSLQTLMSKDVLVGGRTALELKGYTHYLEFSGERTIRLYADTALPAWLSKLPELGVRFEARRPDRLFGSGNIKAVCLAYRTASKMGAASLDVEAFEWGRPGQAILISTLERAVLELLETLPDRDSFHQVDLVFEGLSSLRPRKMQALLERCRSIKTKRLFFFYARRHQHGWFKYLDEAAVDLGHGKRSIVPGGTLDPHYLITVPSELTGQGAR